MLLALATNTGAWGSHPGCAPTLYTCPLASCGSPPTPPPPVHCARPQHPRPEMGLEVAHRAWSCSPCHLGQGAFRSHYRALSQWASYLSALHLHSGFFGLQRPPRACLPADPVAATLSIRAAASRVRGRLLRSCSQEKHSAPVPAGAARGTLR